MYYEPSVLISDGWSIGIIGWQFSSILLSSFSSFTFKDTLIRACNDAANPKSNINLNYLTNRIKFYYLPSNGAPPFILGNRSSFIDVCLLILGVVVFVIVKFAGGL